MENTTMTKSKEAINYLHATSKRAVEIRKAMREYPGMEIGSAYKKWKEARGETPEPMLSTKNNALEKESRSLLAQLKLRQCTATGCTGTQHLESVCSGCIEGQAGYKTKWTCNLCMHRDLSRDDIHEWIQNLSSL